MLKQLQEVRWSLSALLNDENLTPKKDCDLRLSEDQWSLFEDLLPLLAELKDATKQLSGEKYLTISCVLPVMYHLYQTNRNPVMGERAAVKEV